MAEPGYIFADAKSLPWKADATIPGMEIKSLGTVSGQAMELFRFAPNTPYPKHLHKGPEFVYMLEGRARLAGQWLEAGWSSVGDAGSVDEDFLSGADGCVLLAVYTP